MLFLKLRKVATDAEVVVGSSTSSASSAPFDPARQIRVLVLDEGEHLSNITATFSFITLDLRAQAAAESKVAWDAVSYAWEGQALSESIILDGKYTPVTPNVYAILRDLRRGREKRSLWIDALCINQRDDGEKSLQVAIMRHVYEKARSVIIWLSPTHHRALKDVAEAAHHNSSQQNTPTTSSILTFPDPLSHISPK